MSHQLVLVLDFGGQYNQLIARRVRECGVYCEVKSYKTSIDEIKALNPIGIIFTGGPNSAYLSDSPKCDPAIYSLGIPILGLCYGAQLMASMLGGTVRAGSGKLGAEFGKITANFNTSSPLFSYLCDQSIVWMSHNDYIAQAPDGFSVVSSTANCPVAAMQDTDRNLYALQFHPEVMHTENGTKILDNFLSNVCKCSRDWSMKSYAVEEINRIKAQVDGKKVLLALSGGVDSSVCAKLLSKACGSNLYCIFIDHGMMRKDEGDEVEAAFANDEFNFIRVNAGDRFLGKLKGVTDPEQKRKIIGEEFIRVFEDEAKKIGAVDILAQGTIYPDVIESGLGDANVIKSHHNVGGLPSVVDFKAIIEPLYLLFKDEVRKLGVELGLSDTLVNRQPFPGPGLAVRVIGEITEDKLEILREADFIFRDEIAKAGIANEISQYFAVITNMRSVGVMGDVRTYDYTLALRAVTTSDFMTAEWAKIPYDVLEVISSRIVNEVSHINRIVYDITTKPPATIEWE